MKKYLILLLGFSASCSPKIVEKSLWQAWPVTVDASTSEYGEMHLYNSDSKMFYSISNDASNLYLCFTTKDESIQRQIMLAGMEVWMDTTTKSKQLIGVKYPLKASQMPVPQVKPNSGPRQKPDIPKMRQNFLLSQQVADIKGFKNMPDGLSPLETKVGFKLKMEWDSNQTLIYELQIPLENWYRRYSIADSTKIFTLMVKVNGVQMPGMSGPPADGGFRRSPQDGSFQNPPPGGMGNVLSRGRRPGNNRPMNGMMAMSESHSFKVNFKLTVNAK